MRCKRSQFQITIVFFLLPALANTAHALDFIWTNPTVISDAGVFPVATKINTNSALATWLENTDMVSDSPKTENSPNTSDENQATLANPFFHGVVQPLLDPSLGTSQKSKSLEFKKGYHCLKPATASDGHGNFAVVCENINSYNNVSIALRIYHAKDDTWELKQISSYKGPFTTSIPDPRTESTNTVDVAMSDDGGIWVTWLIRSEYAYQRIPLGQVWAIHFDPKDGWSRSTRLDTSGFSKQATEPRVTTAPNGSGLIIWSQYDSSGQSIWARYFDNATGKKKWAWTSTVLEKGDYVRSFSPDLKLDAAGNGLVIWAKNGALMSRRFANEGYFDQIKKLNTGNMATSHAISPKLVMNSKGEALVAWLEVNPINLETNVQALRYSNNNGDPIWSDETKINIDSSGVSYAIGPIFPELSISIDEEGNSTAVWTHMKTNDKNKTIYSLRFNYLPFNSFWIGEGKILSSQTNIQSPSLVSTLTEKHQQRFYVLWSESSAEKNNEVKTIQYSMGTLQAFPALPSKTSPEITPPALLSPLEPIDSPIKKRVVLVNR